jgi:hypothetical protein
VKKIDVFSAEINSDTWRKLALFSAESGQLGHAGQLGRAGQLGHIQH